MISNHPFGGDQTRTPPLNWKLPLKSLDATMAWSASRQKAPAENLVIFARKNWISPHWTPNGNTVFQIFHSVHSLRDTFYVGRLWMFMVDRGKSKDE